MSSGPFFMLISVDAKFILLINIKLPTIVGILTFISMIDTTPEQEISLFVVFFRFYEQLKFRTQLSLA